jgi:hypothetical protein
MAMLLNASLDPQLHEAHEGQGSGPPKRMMDRRRSTRLGAVDRISLAIAGGSKVTFNNLAGPPASLRMVPLIHRAPSATRKTRATRLDSQQS